MRTLEDAKKWWPLLEKQTSLAELQAAIKLSEEESVITGLRSACWKVFLLFEDFDRSRWSAKLQSSREAYVSLRGHLLRGLENEDELDVVFDPLSENDNQSPWHSLRKDEEHREEIFQDVERCMPDNLYFRQPATQNMLLDILFVWSKLNPDTAYRQGMHEILAPILWAVERDAIDPQSSGLQEGNGRQLQVGQMFDADCIAHDSFTLFSLVMQHAKPFYEQNVPSVPSTRPTAGAHKESPMVLRSRRIIEKYLAKTDPPLAAHLQDIELIPQVFLMRWVRLLFGREFSFNHVLSMWDRLFAEDPTLECVDLVCVAMLLRIRWRLMESDNSSALTLLLHYPDQSAKHLPSTLVDDALYLRNNMNFDGGFHIISKYSKRPPPMINRPPSPAESRRAFSPLSSPRKLVQNSGGLEALLENAAREVYTRGERWGVNKAVRDAVGEVRKNVQGLQTRTQSHSRTSSSTETESPSAEALVHKIEALEARNRSLAKMLEGAVSELWQQQKEASNDPSTNEKAAEALTMAVARVQFVQVYLEDSSLPLPAEELTPKPATEVLPTSEQQAFPPEQSEPTPSRVTESADPPSPNPEDTPRSPPKPPQPAPPAPAQPRSHLFSSPPQRPPLTQSSFSWILGQDKPSDFDSPRSAFLHTTSPFTMPPSTQQSLNRRSAARTSVGFLFGDDEEGVGEEKRGNGGGKAPKGKGKGKGKGRGKREEVDAEAEAEEVVRLGTLRGK